MDGLINGLLKAHPNRKRAAQELQDLDADDLLDHISYDLDFICDPYGFSSSVPSASRSATGAAHAVDPLAAVVLASYGLAEGSPHAEDLLRFLPRAPPAWPLMPEEQRGLQSYDSDINYESDDEERLRFEALDL